MDVVHTFTDGAQVAVESGGAVYFLTPCCHASGKGSASETGVVCRRCYTVVSPAFGDVGVPPGKVQPEFGIGTVGDMLRRWMPGDVAALVSAQVDRLARDGKVVPSSGGLIWYW